MSNESMSRLGNVEWPRLRMAVFQAVLAHRVCMLAALVAAIAVLVRLPFLDWPLTIDEAGYAYGAQRWFEGVTLYGDDLWFDRPQGIFVAYRLGMWVFGEDTEGIRLLGAAWSAGTAAFVFLIANRMLGLRTAALAGMLVAVVSVAPAIDGYVSNAEVFMVAAVTASAYLTWGRRWFAAGLLAGLAILLKPSGGAAVLLGLLWLAHGRESRQTWIAFLAGAALPIAIAFLHGVVTVGYEDYLYATVLFRFGAGGEGEPLDQLLTGIGKVWPVVLPLVLLTVAGNRRLHQRPRERQFLALWAATSGLGIAMGGNWFEHYFLQVVPPLSIFAAVALRVPAVAVTWPRRAVTSAVAASMVLPLILAFGVLVVPWARLDAVEGSTRLYDMTGYQQNEEIGAYLRDHTPAEGTVLVAFSHASIQYLTERRSSTPYLYKQQVEHVPGALESIVESVRLGEPSAVLLIPSFVDRYDPDGLLRSALPERYAFDRSFGGAEVWVPR